MITYKHYQNNVDVIDVYLDLKHVGCILYTLEGWQYTHKGQKNGGDFYPTLIDCKRSLEGQ